jgi:REP element-mobilizing transposase RayT
VAAVFDRPYVVSLTLTAHQRRALLSSPEQVAVAVDALRTLHASGWAVLAYCVMPEHVHVVVGSRGRQPGVFVQVFKAITTKRLRRLGLVGPVWQRNYHDRVVRRSEGLLRTIRYVLLNPVRKGLVEDWRSWHGSGSLTWQEIDDELLADTRREAMAWSEIEPEETSSSG